MRGEGREAWWEGAFEAWDLGSGLEEGVEHVLYSSWKV